MPSPTARYLRAVLGAVAEHARLEHRHEGDVAGQDAELAEHAGRRDLLDLGLDQVAAWGGDGQVHASATSFSLAIFSARARTSSMPPIM